VPQWPVLAFALAYHAELVQVVFGGKFVEYSWLLPLIVGFGMIESVAVPVTLVAQYEERAGLILLSKVTIAYNILAMLLLVPLAGLYGAVLARGSAVALKNGFIWWHVRHRAVWGNALSFLLSGTALWGGVALLCIALKTSVAAPAVVHLALGAVLCGAAVLLYVRTPAIARTDRDILASLFHGREARTLERLGILKPLGNGTALP
jgi:O-antigen/teichoic acid export membrane protein